MRFLLEMGLSRNLIPVLEKLGHPSQHLHDLGLGHLDDPAILDLARRDGAVLLTHDLDFADLVAASGGRVPSVVLFRLRDMRPQNVAAHLNRVLLTCREALTEGAIASVSEASIRVRELPLDE